MGFLQFLREKSLLTDDQIIDGMIYQETNKYSLITLLKSDESIKNEELISVIDYANDNELTLIESAKENKLLNEEQISNILTLQIKNSSGLAQWILNEDILSATVLEQTLEEFRKSKRKLKAVEFSEVTETVKVKDEKKTETNTSFNAAALESLSALGISADELQDDGPNDQEKTIKVANECSEDQSLHINSNGQLQSFFTKEKKDDLMQIIKSLAFGLKIEKVKALHSEVNHLLGVSKMTEQVLLEKALGALDKVLQSIISEEIDYTKFNFSQVLKYIKESIIICWEIKEHFIIQGNINKYISEGESKNNYLKNIENLIRVNQKGKI